MAAPAVAAHAVPGVSFDPARLEQRRRTLGASEIGAVAGLNPHRNAYDVWAEKTGRAQPFAGNAFTEWGLRLEGAIAQKYAEVMGASIATSDTLLHPQHPWASATPDRLVELDGERFGLEVKRFNEHRADEFGVPGTDEIPHEVAAQCQWSMLVAGLTRWDLAVLLGQADFRIYRLHFNAQVAGGLFDIGHEFWHQNVLADVEPAIDAAAVTERYLKSRFPTHTERLLEATPEQFHAACELAELKARIKELESQAEPLENTLKLAIGEAAGLAGVCTWKAPKSGPVSWKAIAEALGAAHHPELVKQHTGTPSRRFLLSIKAG